MPRGNLDFLCLLKIQKPHKNPFTSVLLGRKKKKGIRDKILGELLTVENWPIQRIISKATDRALSLFQLLFSC